MSLSIYVLIIFVWAVGRVSEGYNLTTHHEEYDLENLVSEFGLQYCSIVEIGQGFCSIFAEFRDPEDTQLLPGTVAEVFLGECECARLRDWELCGWELREARGEVCKFKEATGRDPTPARVHRRLCDFDHILASRNKPCDCQRRFDERSLRQVKGFLTCFRSPLPRTICSRHSVCGVHKCRSELVEGLALVQCDPKCKGNQPFCEEESNPPVVTSYWSEWGPDKTIAFSSAHITEAICLSRDTRAPAFDCLGPGAYCCPQNVENCFCDVEINSNGKKVRRFFNIEHLHYPRSLNFLKKKKRSWIWNKLFLHTAPPFSSETPQDLVFILDYKNNKNVTFENTTDQSTTASLLGQEFVLPSYLNNNKKIKLDKNTQVGFGKARHKKSGPIKYGDGEEWLSFRNMTVSKNGYWEN